MTTSTITAASAIQPSTKSAGLLLAAFEAGETEPLEWAEVTCDDLVITVARDAMKAAVGDRAGVRLPVSYTEAVRICRALDCVSPTESMCKAMFAQASVQMQFVGLVNTAADSARMGTVGFSLKFDDGVRKQLPEGPTTGVLFGAWKLWILHPRITIMGAVNFGFRNKLAKPPEWIQTPGARHDASHSDYSQLFQPVKRTARDKATGAEVDLLEYIERREKIPERYIDVYQPPSTVKAVAFQPTLPIKEAPVAPEKVDLARVLAAAGLDSEPVDGWQERGGSGFAPVGIMVHHTAGPKTGDAPSLNVCVKGRPDLSGPLCHLLLARSGKFHLIAANKAHHAGGGSQKVLDLVKADEQVVGSAAKNNLTDTPGLSGNPHFYGIEVENNGTGEPYPDVQIDALVRFCAALCQAHGWSPHRVIHHKQWTRRKIDMSFTGTLNDMIAQVLDAESIDLGEARSRAMPLMDLHPGGEECTPGDVIDSEVPAPAAV